VGTSSLAACRAVLFAQLVDDPSAHPEEFPTDAEHETERKRLFDLINGWWCGRTPTTTHCWQRPMPKS